jgi:hypothetical protein
MTENLARNLMKYGFDQIHAAPSGMRSPSRAETDILLIAYAAYDMIRSVHIGTQRVILVFTAFGTGAHPILPIYFSAKKGLSTAQIGVHQSSHSAQTVKTGLG